MKRTAFVESHVNTNGFEQTSTADADLEEQQPITVHVEQRNENAVADEHLEKQQTTTTDMTTASGLHLYLYA